MECGRYVGQNPESSSLDFHRCGRDRRRSLVHRRHDCASASLRRWRWKKKDPEEPADHALGRSRGGFSTKIHLLCDANGIPLDFHLTAGQTHESTALDELLASADTKLIDGNKRRIAWPISLAGDMGYRADWIDQYLFDLGVQPVIPTPSNQDRSKRIVTFDKKAYRNRNIIERLIGWLKECRRIFARFEKTAKNFAGMIKMAFIQRYFKLLNT